MREAKFTVSIEGIEQLNQLFEEVGASLDPAKIEPVLLQAAALVALAVRKEAPYRTKARSHQGSKHIRDSIDVKHLKARAGFPAPAIAAVDRKMTPHAVLVERGTKERRHKNGKTVGKMPKNPYFTRAVNATADQAVEYVLDTLGDKLEGALR